MKILKAKLLSFLLSFFMILGFMPVTALAAEPNLFHLLVNGVDIRNINQHKLRDEIGYVPQKAVLFSGTIDSNIRYGAEGSTKEDIREAASIAQAMEFIESKPDKFETEISQGGTNVSGGQKQRLSIARALAKKPKIFIFDDSF